jgi:hypothetical protein
MLLNNRFPMANHALQGAKMMGSLESPARGRARQPLAFDGIRANRCRDEQG